ncbi:MAG: 4-hydroxy-3-methylbut-2-enyl diphosphate reductase [Paracoccaceae bacterium]
MTVVLATPRGFCAGVERAIEIVERALAKHGAPVYVRHEIVHNPRVVAELRARGAVFVREVDEIPEGAVTIFSAHGVARRVENDAAGRGLEVIDATCPLVAKVHHEGRRYAAQGRTLILIGHAGHPEVVGTLGQIEGPVHLAASADEIDALPIPADAAVAYVTQTTLSVTDTREIIAAIHRRWPGAEGPDTRDICYATQNRQEAVRRLASDVDRIIVVGAQNSSNSNRLREIAEAEGRPAVLIAEAGELDLGWLADADRVGITAGASAPEVTVHETVARLGRHFRVETVTLPGLAEEVAFKLPPGLAKIKTLRPSAFL